MQNKLQNLTVNNYYHILGITSNATVQQIKKAYRAKAKQYHPDINKAKDANEQFILLNEAYEYLLNTTGNSTNRIKRAQEKAEKQAKYQQQWEQQERQKARERAQEHARMKYEAFLKSDVYKATEAINVIFDILLTGVILLLIVVLPILTIREHGSKAILFWIFILLPSSPLWFRFIVRLINSLNTKHISFKHKPSIRSRVRNIFLGFVGNIVIFIFIVLNTLIQAHTILSLYGTVIILSLVISLFIKNSYYKYLIYFDLSPGMISLFFLLNFLFSSNPQSETYPYTLPYQSSPLYTTIKLEGNAHREYANIRLFLSNNKVKGNNLITYHFEEGLFGIKIVKSIETHLVY
ncbi:DnaJ domain-containing protein [Saccharicrinis fermentans]|uniref:Chaperone protein DnaJ n=1 Tax=Saccharicrinis fermentans DSM 9555 = JCM 21142 TaxID=869213 RepID=W7YAL5_9BACT|nr:DnaJ domain-containing protein [Saccharicrinis fermentans]GAF04598.1 chaperone protein DnaJ [Saccharicrinis fermentans DSM 9555 = JCM 21142]